MDLTTIIGITGGLILVFTSVTLRGGLVGLQGFLDIPSAMITFGGTFAAVLVNYPMVQVLKALKVVKKVFREQQEDPASYIEVFRHLIIKASREGVISLESDLKDMENDFLRNGVKKVVDGQSYELIKEEMETEIAFTRERHRVGQEIFVTLGTYSPAFGMIGTIMGLILMLAQLEDQAQIASGMAVALLTTFYGALAAYILFLPIAGKLKRRSEEELFIKRVIIRGVLSLQSGEIPSIAVSKLKAYIPRSLFVDSGQIVKKEKDESDKKKSGGKSSSRKKSKKYKKMKFKNKGGNRGKGKK